MKKGTLLYLLLLQSFLLFGQVDIVSDNIIQTTAGVKINQCLVTKDGRIACVGEQTSGNNTQGYFLLYDPQNSEKDKQVLQQTFGGSGHHGFTSIAEADNGTFFIVGYSETNVPSSGIEGWLVQLDVYESDCKPLLDQKTGSVGDDRFDKILWLENGTGIIAGRSASQPNAIWLHTLEAQKGKYVLVPKPTLESGVVSDIIGLMSVPGKNDVAWLCGNTQRHEGVWMLQVDTLGTESNYIKFKNRGTVLQASSLKGNRLVLAGELFNVVANRNVWWLEVSQQLKSDNSKNVVRTYATHTEIPTALCVLAPNRFLMSVSVESGSQKGEAKNSYNSIKFFNNGKDEGIKADNVMPSDYTLQFLENLRQNGKILAIGCAKEGDKLRFVEFKNTRTLASAKGMTKLEISNVRLHATKNADVLQPKEIASIMFDIKNIGDADMRTDGHVIITEEKLMRGITITKKEQYFLILEKGMSRTVSVSVRTAEVIDGGESIITISVLEGSNKIASYPYRFRSAPNGNQTVGTQIHFQNPPAGFRRINTTENSYKIKAEVISSNTKTTSPIVYKSNLKIPDGKNKPYVSDAVLSNGQYRFDFAQDVMLERGDNVFKIDYEDASSDSIIIHYEPSKPNLHILSIGVPDKNLKFTSKDASDFATRLKEQEGSGLFDNVYVDTLLDSIGTTRQSIESAFGRLRNRVKENADRRIQPKDYLYIFISSHGTIRDEDGKFALIPSDFDPVLVTSTTVDFKLFIETYINKIDCHRFVFIDACHSGAGKRPSNADLSQQLRLINESNRGITTFTSCSAKEQSWEHPNGENGVFTTALLEAFSGKPVKLHNNTFLPVDDRKEPTNPLSKGDNFVTIEELNNFLIQRVPDIVLDLDNKPNQTPECLSVDSNKKLALFIIK